MPKHLGNMKLHPGSAALLLAVSLGGTASAEEMMNANGKGNHAVEPEFIKANIGDTVNSCRQTRAQCRDDP